MKTPPLVVSYRLITVAIAVGIIIALVILGLPALDPVAGLTGTGSTGGGA